MSWNIFSQNVTNKVDSVVVIKKEVAKKIAKDLNRLDECLATKTILDSNINLLTQQINNKDSIIFLEKKISQLNYENYLSEKYKYNITSKQYLDTQKKLKWSKTKTTVSQLALVVLAVLIAIKK